MKSKNISVLVLSITLILVSLILVSSFGLSRPKQNSQWITFSGDLAGSQEVIGCCPNAGPNPEYTMTLSELVFPIDMRGEHDGNIFMNVVIDLSEPRRGKRKATYMVKFNWTEGDTKYFIEIRGGEAHKDKKTKILTVTFDDVPCKIWINDDPKEPVTVSFNLTRAQMYY